MYQQQPQQASDLEILDEQRRAAWFAYSELQCAPGWQQESIDAATAAARAQYAYDIAKRGH